MKHIEFEGANLRLNPPAGSTPGEIGVLVAYQNPSDGSIVSAWKPSAEELQGLNEGGHVMLHVYGGMHPPVAMHVQKMKERSQP